MRYLILIIITVVLTLFIFLVVAVEDDGRWFQDFSKNHEHFDHTLVARVADLTLIDPPPPDISLIPVFAISKGDSVAITTFQNLRQVYLMEYQNQFQKYSQFLYEVLNNKIKLNTEKPSVRVYCQTIFKVDSTVKSLFEKEGITGFLKRYLSRSDSSYVKTTYELSSNQQNSIAYYLFMNGLVKHRDDYHGKVYFKKLVPPAID